MSKKEKKPIVGYYLEGEILCPRCFQNFYPKFLEEYKSRGLDAPEFERIREGNLMKGGLTWAPCNGTLENDYPCSNLIETGLEE